VYPSSSTSIFLPPTPICYEFSDFEAAFTVADSFYI
jgi:hypothetical protein